MGWETARSVKSRPLSSWVSQSLNKDFPEPTMGSEHRQQLRQGVWNTSYCRWCSPLQNMAVWAKSRAVTFKPHCMCQVQTQLASLMCGFSFLNYTCVLLQLMYYRHYCIFKNKNYKWWSKYMQILVLVFVPTSPRFLQPIPDSCTRWGQSLWLSAQQLYLGIRY